MTKAELLQLLRDPDVCHEIFEIVKKGGKPVVDTPKIQPTPQTAQVVQPVQPQAVQPSQPKFSSIGNKLKQMYPNAAQQQPQTVQPQATQTAQPVQPQAAQPSQPVQPTQAAQSAQPKFASIADKLRYMYSRRPEYVVEHPPETQTSTEPQEEAPKSFSSIADKLQFLRGHLDKVREQAKIEAAQAVEKSSTEKYTLIMNRRCPICEKDTRVVKPKARLNVERRDTDYCVHYKDFDPYLYTVFACEHCGFAAEEKKFTGVWPKKLRDNLREFLTQNDMKLPFVEERTAEDALNLFELAILFSELTDHSKGRQAILDLNAAWVCRCENLPDRERDFMEQAAANFATALDGERWPINGISDDMATYLCAAIYYLIKDYEDATKWLGRTMNNANLRTTAPKLFEQARDIWQEIKRANKA